MTLIFMANFMAEGTWHMVKPVSAGDALLGLLVLPLEPQHLGLLEGVDTSMDLHGFGGFGHLSALSC